jgi:uncharacterized membrane-anchored protein YhcB (DUF1043 family)
MEQEKDNFWLYIGGLIVGILVLVFIFKSAHNEAIPSKAYEETSKQVEQQLEKQHQK